VYNISIFKYINIKLRDGARLLGKRIFKESLSKGAGVNQGDSGFEVEGKVLGLNHVNCTGERPRRR
jgi:hypothetical protein